MALYFFLATLFLSFGLTILSWKIALKKKFFDYASEPRKIHHIPVPNTGGIAFFVAFWLVVLAFVLINNTSGFYLKYLIGLFLSSLLLFVASTIDDRKRLAPGEKIIFQIIAAVIIILSGIGVKYITNPLGGFFYLGQIQIPLEIAGAIYHLTLWADLLALLWIIGMINIVNFLDGLDGLAGGVSAIAFFIIYLLSISPAVEQPLSAIIALIACGAILGFLPWNLNPAKIFMGDVGSQFLGLVLAVLAIITGSKIATALLVLGLPIFDGLWVVFSRAINGKAPWTADRDHLHHKLLDLGLSRRFIVIIFWLITAAFGAIALTLNTQLKLIAIISLLIFLTISMGVISALAKNRKRVDLV
ncbi:undecaprenyl/decaprenyl-phosphate alpha-N-acetylglucosaminyl 1-phosphate transferase [Candidatus Microgenomates bacterium]|nr:undecaprenyl/decaprenyl-phosphate alpha-N-acetylglucosaminyl 1-phosphate transferase [Candidatus Microgenomates bacterium]